MTIGSFSHRLVGLGTRKIVNIVTGCVDVPKQELGNEKKL